MLYIDFSICQASDCTTLTFNETTGAYNAITNTGGWGAPNDTLADVQTPVTLDITVPGGTVYQIDLASTTPIFPTDDPDQELEIDMSSLGGTAGDTIPDGIYTFVYTVTTSNGTYTQTHSAPLYCNVQCCVMSMYKDLDLRCDCCEQDKQAAIDAHILYKGLIYQANCGNTAAFNNTLAILQKLCTQSNCKGCK